MQMGPDFPKSTGPTGPVARRTLGSWFPTTPSALFADALGSSHVRLKGLGVRWSASVDDVDMG